MQTTEQDLYYFRTYNYNLIIIEMKKMFLSFMSILMLFSGCSKQEVPESPSSHNEVSVQFNLSQILLKSALSANDNINNINIFAYRNGKLLSQHYTEGVSSLNMTLLTGYAYDIYAIANTGKKDAPDYESSLPSFSCQISQLNDLNNGIPMVCSLSDIQVAPGMKPITLILIRMASKINFRIDNSAIPRLKVTSLCLKQSPLDFKPFATTSAASSVDDGDYATASDLTALNSGDTASFYMLENCQGVLLPGNTDQWRKVPEYIPTKKDICTYLEVETEFQDIGSPIGTVIYRLYLGQDNCSDFNIYRNTDNVVILTLTENGLNQVSWKVTPNITRSGIPYTLSAPEYIAQKGTLSITNLPGHKASLASGSTVLSNDNLSLVTSDNLNYTVIGKKAGTATIFISATGYSTVTVNVTIKAPTLKFEDASYNLYVSGTATSVKAHYHDSDDNLLYMNTSTYDQATYNTYLNLSYGLDNRYGFNFVGHSGYSYYVKLFYDSTLDEVINTYYGDNTVYSATVTPSNAESGVSAASVPLIILNPFPTAGTNLGTIDDNSRLGSAYNTTISLPVSCQTDNSSWKLYNSANVEFANSTVNYDGTNLNFVFAYDKDTPTPAGQCHAVGKVTNSYSNEIANSDNYGITVWARVAVCADIRYTSSHAGVYYRYSGYVSGVTLPTIYGSQNSSTWFATTPSAEAYSIDSRLSEIGYSSWSSAAVNAYQALYEVWYQIRQSNGITIISLDPYYQLSSNYVKIFSYKNLFSTSHGWMDYEDQNP